MAFVNDTFTDTDSTIITSHTGETGATWVRQFGHTGDSYIQSNRLAYGSGVAVHRASGTPASADYSVFGWLYVASTVSGSAAGAIARAQSGAGTYYYGGYVQGAGWRLYKYIALSGTQLGSTAAQTLTVGQTYLIELRVVGDQISLYVDGTLKVGPVTDTSITTAGSAGARLYLGSASTGYHLDRITDDNGGGGGTVYSLDSDAVSHSQAISALSQTAIFALAGNNVSHTQTVSTLSQAVIFALAANGITHTHALDQIIVDLVTSVISLDPVSISHAQAVSAVALGVKFALSPQGITQAQTLANASMGVKFALSPDSIGQGQDVAQITVSLSNGDIILPASAFAAVAKQRAMDTIYRVKTGNIVKKVKL